MGAVMMNTVKRIIKKKPQGGLTAMLNRAILAQHSTAQAALFCHALKPHSHYYIRDGPSDSDGVSIPCQVRRFLLDKIHMNKEAYIL